MSTAVIPSPVTVDEFILRPMREDGCFEELIEGVIYVSPNVKPRHNGIARNVDRLLQPLEQGGFIVLGEVACRLTQRSLPNTDVCVLRRENWDKQNPDEFFTTAPPLVVEIKSPGNTGKKLRLKSALYLEHGAEQVWIVRPNTRTVLVMTPEAEDREAREGEHVEFQGLRIAVTDLFA